MRRVVDWERLCAIRLDVAAAMLWQQRTLYAENPGSAEEHNAIQKQIDHDLHNLSAEEAFQLWWDSMDYDTLKDVDPVFIMRTVVLFHALESETGKPR